MGQIEAWVGRFAHAAADLFDLPAIPVDLPLEIKESKGFAFKWQDDPSILPALSVPALVVMLPQKRAVSSARTSLAARMREFVDRNVGRLHYHFYESMKVQWLDLWRRTENVLRTLEWSLQQAADVLAASDPANDGRRETCHQSLAEIERIERMLQET